MKRFSKKRQRIIEILASTDTHPTAEWVFEKLKKEYPSVSPATVYRNLKELSQEGVIDSVGTVREKEHFDACTEMHVHFVCRKCGKITDAKETEIPQSLKDGCEKMNFSLGTVNLVGICAECKND